MEERAKSDALLLYRVLRQVYANSKETYSEKKAEALFSRFIANDTWQVPTLVVARFVARINTSNKRSSNAALQTSGIERVLRRSPCPTLIVRTEHRPNRVD